MLEKYSGDLPDCESLSQVVDREGSLAHKLGHSSAGSKRLRLYTFN